MPDQDIYKVLLDQNKVLGELTSDVRTIKEEIVGTEQNDGLKQRVDDLESAKDRVYGGGGVILFLLGIAEWLFHRK
jgi:hypothetical protein